jgi:hypothetical protein
MMPLWTDRHRYVSVASSYREIPCLGRTRVDRFVVLDDVEVDGFTLGKISDFEAEAMDYGDAFVIGLDGRRAGLVWAIGEVRVEPILAPDSQRWGVWAVWLPHPMRTRDDARRNLAALMPLLKPHWEATGSA